MAGGKRITSGAIGFAPSAPVRVTRSSKRAMTSSNSPERP